MTHGVQVAYGLGFHEAQQRRAHYSKHLLILVKQHGSEHMKSCEQLLKSFFANAGTQKLHHNAERY